jgi:hypothetical protein
MMVSSGATIYHSPEFYRFVRSHERLLKSESVRTPLDPGMVYNFEHNFISLLIEMKLPLENLAFLMVCNDMVDPTELTRDMKEMVLPPESRMDSLKNLFRQREGIV